MPGMQSPIDVVKPEKAWELDDGGKPLFRKTNIRKIFFEKNVLKSVNNFCPIFGFCFLVILILSCNSQSSIGQPSMKR